MQDAKTTPEGLKRRCDQFYAKMAAPSFIREKKKRERSKKGAQVLTLSDGQKMGNGLNWINQRGRRGGEKCRGGDGVDGEGNVVCQDFKVGRSHGLTIYRWPGSNYYSPKNLGSRGNNFLMPFSD